MKQGTISVLFGCHSPIHSYYVIKAWKRLYGSYPKPWEVACIFLHDIGHIGKNYLDNPKDKAEHWRLGAELAGLLFGWKGFTLCAGHCGTSGHDMSKMWGADKLSWLLAHQFWLVSNGVVEPMLRRPGESIWQNAKNWPKEVAKAIKEDKSNFSAHDLWKRRSEGKP